MMPHLLLNTVPGMCTPSDLWWTPSPSFLEVASVIMLLLWRVEWKFHVRVQTCGTLTSMFSNMIL